MKPEKNLYTKKIRYCKSFSQFKYLQDIKLGNDILNYYMKKGRETWKEKAIHTICTENGLKIC